MIYTVGHLRAEIFARLKSAGIDRAEWETRQLLCEGAGMTIPQILLGSGMYLPEETAGRVLALAARRASGEPLAYIWGRWEIFGLELLITPDVLIPREDTGVLIETCGARLAHLAAGVLGEGLPGDWPIREAANKQGEGVSPLPPVDGSPPGVRILDLCCGSGCVGIALAKAFPGVHVTLADISEPALRLAKQNARKSLGGNEVICVPADALAPPSPHLGRFDVIACNPPYIADGEWPGISPSVRDFEPEPALRGGADGLDFYRALSARWGAALRPGGSLIFEVGYRQAAAVRDILAGAGFTGIETARDGQGYERVVSGILPCSPS